MTRYLLDVNTLIALIAPSPLQHEQAHGWFSRARRKSFATGPLTENGLVRIVGHPKYPNSHGPPSVVLQSRVAIRALDRHVFWHDSTSIADAEYFSADLLSRHSRAADGYLLALTQANKEHLATMDHKLAGKVVPGGRARLELI